MKIYAVKILDINNKYVKFSKINMVNYICKSI